MAHPQLENAVGKADAFMAKYPTLFQYDKLKQLEDQTGYSKVYFAVAVFLALGTVLFVLGGAKLVSDLVSFVYPAYASFKAIDSATPNEDTQWLTYWVVFAFFSIVENCTWFLVSWIPFYFVLKLGFFVWLYHPSFLGAGLVYNQMLRPLVLPYVQGPMAGVQKKTT